MIAFDVFFNGKKLARAGVGSDGVLTAIAMSVRRRASRSGGKRSQRQRELSFSLDGYRSTTGEIGEHFKWDERKLKPGDVVTIKVITATQVDEPRRRVMDDPKSIERSQKRYYQRLKRKFAAKKK